MTAYKGTGVNTPSLLGAVVAVALVILPAPPAAQEGQKLKVAGTVLAEVEAAGVSHTPLRTANLLHDRFSAALLCHRRAGTALICHDSFYEEDVERPSRRR
jgi:hypothetical protein